jgi:hypothetical protein
LEAASISCRRCDIIARSPTYIKAFHHPILRQKKKKKREKEKENRPQISYHSGPNPHKIILQL